MGGAGRRKSRLLACATRWTVELVTGMGETRKRRGLGGENTRLGTDLFMERYFEDNLVKASNIILSR